MTLWSSLSDDDLAQSRVFLEVNRERLPTTVEGSLQLSFLSM